MTHLTRSDVTKQAKVVDRWREKRNEFKNLSPEQLNTLMQTKMSQTDKHALRSVISELKPTAEEAVVQPSPVPEQPIV